jgi:cytochrome d ubiquinol oxidase subunit I
MTFDPIILSRIQFAFAVSFHIIFPSFTIGLASMLAIFEAMWLKTGLDIYHEIYKFWVKIFAITFGMGVVSGVALSYQFGTNWSGFSYRAGNILGPLLSLEVLTAFFLESSFLGIMLFGDGKVTKKMHFISTLIVAIGTIISAFWIISAVSWMHTPRGYTIIDNIFIPINWYEIIFNPSFIYRFSHMIIAAFITTAFVIAGSASYYLLQNKDRDHAKIMLKISLLMMLIFTPMQLFVGDLHGLNSLKHQPSKVAAIEALWNTKHGAELTLFAIPNKDLEINEYSIAIPKLASLILTRSWNGKVLGLKEWKKEDRPPILIVFLCFRIMVGIGILMLITSFVGLYLYIRQKLFKAKLFQYWCILMTPSGFVAILSGWFVTEIGRQPYIIYNLMRTKEAVSPVPHEYILTSLICFILVYSIIFGAGLYYILNLIKSGPSKTYKNITYS